MNGDDWMKAVVFVDNNFLDCCREFTALYENGVLSGGAVKSFLKENPIQFHALEHMLGRKAIEYVAESN